MKEINVNVNVFYKVILKREIKISIYNIILQLYYRLCGAISRSCYVILEIWESK